jgi:hypothetical protein
MIYTRPMTGVEQQILSAIQQRGGRVEGLQPLLTDLQIDYSWGYAMTRRLAYRGRLHIRQRPGGPGAPLVLELATHD